MEIPQHSWVIWWHCLEAGSFLAKAALEGFIFQTTNFQTADLQRKPGTHLLQSTDKSLCYSDKF
jgi:hypothetical protein